MFNPFVPFHTKMIDPLRKMSRRYLVSQTNHHAADECQEDPRIPILLSDYEDVSIAQVHLNALTDKYKAMMDLENERHRGKLLDMLSPESKYKVYSAFIPEVKSVENRMNQQYSVNIRNYISRMTNWRVGGEKTINPKLEMIFGELFVTLKYGGQSVRIKLAELEKY